MPPTKMRFGISVPNLGALADSDALELLAGVEAGLTSRAALAEADVVVEPAGTAEEAVEADVVVVAVMEDVEVEVVEEEVEVELEEEAGASECVVEVLWNSNQTLNVACLIDMFI